MQDFVRPFSACKLKFHFRKCHLKVRLSTRDYVFAGVKSVHVATSNEEIVLPPRVPYFSFCLLLKEMIQFRTTFFGFVSLVFVDAVSVN